MKNNRKAVIAFFGASFLLLGACQQGQKKEESTSPKQEEEKEVLPPEGIISLEESKSLYDNYTKNRVDMIRQFEETERNPDEKFIPSRFTSFSFDKIKNYTAYVEQEAKKAGVKIASFRLYFANYPDKPDFPDGKKIVHPRQNSIFIVPTMMVDGEEYGFYIGADGKAKLIKNAVGGSEIGPNGEKDMSNASFAPAVFADDDESLVLNKGNSSPPPNGDYDD
ncbi:hypothetical protein PY092_07590 [Muricauda sp. 334s03]|uniref:Lipoprotein n=1 Tax=Flagellimonas yonaguniensis TaxID=3031325 RepID=A0ABT5XXY6_9FLAO|nr:hypothetical protein [[Muricauda] yonaguniensis]MDF0716005.1 hypothetical protein [[Muricauda] yonaguniensis]